MSILARLCSMLQLDLSRIEFRFEFRAIVDDDSPNNFGRIFVSCRLSLLFRLSAFVRTARSTLRINEFRLVGRLNVCCARESIYLRFDLALMIDSANCLIDILHSTYERRVESFSFSLASVLHDSDWACQFRASTSKRPTRHRLYQSSMIVPT